MNTIVNVNEKWGIGADGDLLVNIPADMKFFREKTRGKIVVVGLNTLKSFPGMRPLKGRINIVLAEDLSMIPMESIKACDCYIDDISSGDLTYFGVDGSTSMIACTSLSEVIDLVSVFNGEDVYVCGGASVYRLLLPYCDTAYVTKNTCTKEADTFFPDLDADPLWECTEAGEEAEDQGIRYRFTVYRRKEDVI